MSGVTSSEAAARLGISRERLVRILLSGLIRAELVAGRWLVDERSLNEYLSGQCKAATARQPAIAVR